MGGWKLFLFSLSRLAEAGQPVNNELSRRMDLQTCLAVARKPDDCNFLETQPKFSAGWNFPVKALLASLPSNKSCHREGFSPKSLADGFGSHK